MKYTRKIKTPFGYVPVSLNFDCLRIYATSCWILQQISKRELEHRHHVVIRTPSLLCAIRVMAYEFSYLGVVKDDK